MYSNRLAALTVPLTVALLCACAPKAQPSTPPPDWRLNARLGFTECTPDGRPVHWIRGDVVNSAEESFVLLHEERHVEQAGRFQTCRDWLVWYYRNPAEAEAEAFCAGALGEPEFLPAAMKGARWLSGAYGFGLTVEQAFVLIVEACRH